MTVPKPKGGENQNKFISRCMSDSHMKNTYPDQQQRLAVCFNSFRTGKTIDIVSSINKTLTNIKQRREECKK